MAITQLDKMKIIKFFRENKMGEIYYEELVEYMGKKSKVTDLEFTYFFANYVEDNLKKDKVSLNMIAKMISAIIAFLGWLHEDGVVIEDMSLVNVLYKLRDCYEKYILRNNVDRDKDLDDMFPILEERLNEYYPREEQKHIDYDEEIERLRKEIDRLMKEVASKEEEIKKLISSCNKKDKIIEDRKKDIGKLNNKLVASQNGQKELEERIKGLEDLISELRSLIVSLEGQITAADSKYATLDELKKRIQNDYLQLKETIKSLRKEIDSKQREINRYMEDERMKIVIPSSSDYTINMNNRIEGLIIQKMLQGKNDVDQLVEFLLENGYSVSKNEIRRHLNSVKDKLRLEYREQENIAVDEEDFYTYTINVPENSRYYDLMVVSDFHLTSFDKDIIQDMDLINDYCASKGISTIINAGDFFSLSRTPSRQSISVCRKLVERVLTRYPSRTGIVHAVLGGNHDKDMIDYVDDPLKTLSQGRDDFVNLGYGHCKIAFGGAVSILDTIGVHHPNRRFPDPVGAMYTTDKIQNSLYGYYLNKEATKDDVYVDILGHIHKSGLDIENGICIVPSYRKDRVMDGAWHLRIYFGDDGHINNIVFIPIIKQRKLIPTSEINYTKRLIK